MIASSFMTRIVALLATVVACGSPCAPNVALVPLPAATSAPVPPLVSLQRVEYTNVTDSLIVEATLTPSQITNITAGAPGTVATLPSIGARLRSGDVIATLGSGATVKAHADGVVLSCIVQVGTVVAADATMCTTGETRLLVASGLVPESRAPVTKPGQPAHLRAETFPNRLFNATLSRTAPALRDHALPVEADIMNPEESLKPGMTAKLIIEFGTHEHVRAVPLLAVIVHGQKHVVFVPIDGRAHEREVQTGYTDGHMVEIPSGLDDGDTVLVPAAALTDGAPFRQPGGSR